MPAYFNVSVQFIRDEICPSFIKDFYAMLDKAGMVFQSGYRGFEEDSLEEIIDWNQRELQENFKLGFTQNHSHDYKQVIYSFSDYSEVRGFWTKNYPGDGEFTYEIIIPESDVLEKNYPARFKKEKVEELLELSERIWQFPLVKAIQTGLEGSDASASLAKMAAGGIPSIWPFAIVEEMKVCYRNPKYDSQPILEGRKGRLFLRR